MKPNYGKDEEKLDQFKHCDEIVEYYSQSHKLH